MKKTGSRKGERVGTYHINVIMKKVLSIFTVILFCLNIHAQTNSNIAIDSVYANFDRNMKRVFICEAVIEDSIDTKIFFDTGTYGLIVSDSLKIWDKTTNPKKIKIGNNYKSYLSYPFGNLDEMPTRNPVFSLLGVGAVVGWDFFEGKIIELSYKHQYIKLLESVEDLTNLGYKCIPMKRSRNVWGVPSEVVINGKKFNVDLMIDTGNTGALVFNYDMIDKFQIDSKNMSDKSVGASVDSKQRKTTKAESICILSSDKITDVNIAFRSTDRRSPFDGILGNVYFQNFSVILDFQNGDLYLKKIE